MGAGARADEMKKSVRARTRVSASEAAEPKERKREREKGKFRSLSPMRVWEKYNATCGYIYIHT